MMGNDRDTPPFPERPLADASKKGSARKPPHHGIAESLRRAYDASLAEPLPPALADLLRRLE